MGCQSAGIFEVPTQTFQGPSESGPLFVMDDTLERIRLLPSEQQREVLDLLNELNKAKSKDRGRKFFLDCVKHLWADFIEGSHHRIISELFDDILKGKRKRIIVNLPPRHTMSEFASVYL